MKKFGFLGILLCICIITGCNNNLNNTNKLEPFNENLEPNSEIYQGVLEIKGIGPELSLEPIAEEGTLVSIGNFDDHTDHIYFTSGYRESYFANENDYLPGNKIKFKGNVEFIDGAAGNHYYNVSNIITLEIQDYPAESEIKDIIESYNYCESDADCSIIEGECPFRCYIAINHKFTDISINIMKNYLNNPSLEKCKYGCNNIEGNAKCENYKCIIN